MKKEKVSIIVPVYNVEKYLEECINSILNQTYKNIEILLIDDGSVDESPKICDKYSLTYSNVLTFHKKNGGVSKARNYGLEVSTGDYIVFIDSDDIIEKNMIEELVYSMKEKRVDLVACGYTYMYQNLKKDIKIIPHGLISKKEAMEKIFNNNFIRGFSVNKIFKKSILNKYNIHFDEEIKICEDLLFVFEYLSKIKEIYILDKPFYKYRIRKSSATNNAERDLSLFDALYKMEKIDKNVYRYSNTYYIQMFFKYKKELKEKKISLKRKVSFFGDVLFGNIDLKTKLKIVEEILIPKKVRKFLKKQKQKYLLYYE